MIWSKLLQITLEKNLFLFRRNIWTELAEFLLEPFVMYFCLAYGLGAFVGDLQGLSYGNYLAPGFLALTGFIQATIESSKFSHQRFQILRIAPIGTLDLLLAELFSSAIKTTLLTVLLSLLMGRPPIQALLFGFGIFVIALSGSALGQWIGLRGKESIFNLLVLPLSLGSGAYFPLVHIPTSLAWIPNLSPATLAVNLIQSLASDEIVWLNALWPSLALVGLGFLCLRSTQKNLEKTYLL